MANRYPGSSRTKNAFSLLVIATMLAVSFTIANSWIKNKFTYQAGAAAGQASLFVQPDPLTLPPSTKVNIWATTDKSLAFAHVDLTFDRSKIQLTQEITINSTVLSRKVKITSMAEANSTGHIVIALGIDPNQVNSAPTGSNSLASIYLKAISTTSNDVATMSFNTAQSQLVDSGAVPFILTGTNGQITLNPLASPTPSVAPSATPVATDSVAPTVSIAKPTNGSTISSRNFSIAASASDASGISSIVIMFDGKVVTTCTSTTTCTASLNTKKISSGSHTITAKAVDASSLKNTAETTITVNK